MRVRLFRVTGNSMFPAYPGGDYVLAWRHPLQRFAAGDVVVVDHPSYGRIIKRIAAVDADRRLRLTGDNIAESTASQLLGDVGSDRIVGRVICRIGPAPMRTTD
ncbi:S26 family signal peptidase [Algiphilus sp.]|uniref:S26 family signal peptidase n=1 Tax=Algiphilus sp. TaxID=1872431 RepID=UPI003C58C098